MRCSHLRSLSQTLCKLCLDHALSYARVIVDANDFQTGLFDDSSPLRFRSLADVEMSKHHHVHNRTCERRSVFIDDDLIQQNTGISWFERRLEVFEDLQTLDITPIVQDGVK